MKIKYNGFLPVKGFAAMAFFGVILARNEFEPLSERIVRHEEIHALQAKECGGWIHFYLWYAWFWIRCGYKNNPFEREAYDNDFKCDYPTMRKEFNWKKYLKK